MSVGMRNFCLIIRGVMLKSRMAKRGSRLLRSSSARASCTEATGLYSMEKIPTSAPLIAVYTALLELSLRGTRMPMRFIKPVLPT